MSTVDSIKFKAPSLDRKPDHQEGETGYKSLMTDTVKIAVRHIPDHGKVLFTKPTERPAPEPKDYSHVFDSIAPAPPNNTPAPAAPKKDDGFTNQEVSDAKQKEADASHMKPERMTAHDVMVENSALFDKLPDDMKQGLKDRVGDYEKDVDSAVKAAKVLKDIDAGPAVFAGTNNKTIDGFGQSNKTKFADEGSEAAALLSYINDGVRPADDTQQPDDGAPVITGLGKEVDDIVNQSPTMRQQVKTFLDKGGVISQDALVDGAGGITTKGHISIADIVKDPVQLVGILAHELGHGLDYSDASNDKNPKSKEEYLETLLHAEATGEFYEAMVADELGSKGIKLHYGVYSSQDETQAIYKQFQKDGDKEAAIAKLKDAIFNHDDGSGLSVRNRADKWLPQPDMTGYMGGSGGSGGNT
jgi:hypothetical protein